MSVSKAFLLVLFSIAASCNNQNEKTSDTSGGGGKSSNSGGQLPEKLLTDDGHAAVKHVTAAEKAHGFVNIGRIKYKISGKDQKSDSEKFLSAAEAVNLVQSLKTAVYSETGKSNGWSFFECVPSPKNGSDDKINIKDKSQCADILKAPEDRSLVNRYTTPDFYEIMFSVMRGGDGKSYQTVEIAHADRAYAWPKFMTMKPLPHLVDVRFRPHINSNKVLGVPSPTNDFEGHTSNHLKSAFSLGEVPSNLGRLGTLLRQKDDRDEVIHTLGASAAAMITVLSVGEAAHGAVALKVAADKFIVSGGHAGLAKIGAALFKISLGTTAALHETVNVLNLQDVYHDMPESHALHAPLGYSIQVAHLSSYFAIADLAHLGKNLAVSSFRVLAEAKVLAKLKNVGHMKPQQLAAAARSFKQAWPQIALVIEKRAVMGPETLREVAELMEKAVAKAVSASHASQVSSGDHGSGKEDKSGGGH